MSLGLSTVLLLAHCQGYDCLKSYVEKEDDSYSWTLLDKTLEVEDVEGRGGWTGYYLNMTSQTWLTQDQVSRSTWWHIMVVVVPHNLLITDTALLWITDGSNHNDFMPDLGENFDYNLLIAGSDWGHEVPIIDNLLKVTWPRLPGQW